MALVNSHISLVRLVTLLVAGVIALIAAASAPQLAQAATPCVKFGDLRADQLKPRQARAAIKCFINRERQSRGLSNVSKDRRLQRASQQHNNTMMSKACFSHQCAGEGSLDARLRNVGYLTGGLTRWTYGENIAYGGGSYGTPRSIMKSWMKSPGHKANILNPAFREVGVGVSAGIPGKPGSKGGLYTTDFGLRIG